MGTVIDEQKIYQEAIRFYGKYSQINKAIEEAAELVVALQKHKQGRATNVSEEIADVLITCEQLMLIFLGVKEEKERKLRRLEERIIKEKEEENV